MQSQYALLGTRRFLPLFLTQTLGAFNDNVFKNALVILITYSLASKQGLNAQLMVTAAAGIFILPFFLFSATAGQLSDKYDKARLIRMEEDDGLLIHIAQGQRGAGIRRYRACGGARHWPTPRPFSRPRC